MKVVIVQLQPEIWVIQVVSAVALSSGKTTFLSEAAAVAEAQHRYPDAEIEIQSHP